MQHNTSTSDIGFDDLKAAEGLLGLRYLAACSEDMESFQLNPIFVGDSAQTNQQLPPLSYLLSEYASSPSASPSSTQNTSDDFFYNLATPAAASALSISSASSSSASSVGSCTSTSTLQSQQQPQFRSFRTLMHSRRRGRPKKTLSVKMAEEPKVVNFDQVHPQTPVMVSNGTINKPRWQDSERQDLIEAIVKEKSLDDMSTIPWDKVSKAVGRAKKACKDQWRRELLPGLVRGFIRCGNNNNQQPYEDLGNSNSKKRRKSEVRK
jgi:hypothetical protein